MEANPTRRHDCREARDVPRDDDDGNAPKADGALNRGLHDPGRF
jgi:hypothetical protein